MNLTKLLVCAIGALFSLASHGQTTIEGKVVDDINGQPIRGVNVRVDRSMQRAVTNGKGEFRLTNLSKGNHTLSFTHVSYEPLQMKVKENSSTLQVRLTESHQNVGQVVVTGTGTHHRLKDSPVPVQVITAQDIANANVTTLDEALQKLNPSFTTMTNGMGTFMNFNGLGDDYFIFLLNGRKLSGDDTYSRINVNNIKRIEVLNGAYSTLYGTNALGGVINIITDDAKNTVAAQSNTKYSSKGRFDQSITLDVQKGKIGSYTAYKHKRADSWQLSPYQEVTDKKTGETTLEETNKIASTGFHSDGLSERITWDASDRLSFYGEGSYYRNKTDRPIDVYSYDIDHETYGYGLGMKLLMKKGNYLTADFTTDIFNSKYDYLKESGQYQVGDEILRKRVRNHQLTLKGIFTLASWNKLSVGAEYLQDVLKSTSDNIEKETAYTLALFAQDEMQITNHLQAIVGLRYLYHEDFHSYATPNVSLMYKLNHFNLRATYAAGFKAPTLSEVYATDIAKTTDRMTIGNKDLKPEKNNFFGFNAEYTHSRLTLTGNLYYNKVRDMIDYVTILKDDEAMEQYGHKTVRQRQNVNHASVLGVNLTANLYLGYGFSVNGAYNHLKAKDDDTDMPLDKTVRNAWVVGAQWGKTWKDYTLHVNLNGRIYSRRYSESYGYAPHYNLWDLTTRHTINLKKFTVEPGIGVENIFNWTDDRPYNSNYATLNPGRAFYISCALKFKD